MLPPTCELHGLLQPQERHVRGPRVGRIPVWVRQDLRDVLQERRRLRRLQVVHAQQHGGGPRAAGGEMGSIGPQVHGNCVAEYAIHVNMQDIGV